VPETNAIRRSDKSRMAQPERPGYRARLPLFNLNSTVVGVAAGSMMALGASLSLQSRPPRC